eukprot:TRINITY_DN33717_c0_g1_i1.p1 TRINITY_DN33717_c0_g1~~TRINITY_DN33717_c0_g1_i1.p1  ORF type:complete len:721 (-),score=164.97 TRINITY_DN33717_c0_g1_i1:237-2399(-)
MALAMKRKRGDITHDLNKFGCEELLVKKRKPSGVLKLNMDNKDVKTRVFEVVKWLTCHIFATPFLRAENEGRQNKYFDDVLKEIEKNKYENSQQVFDDLSDILNETIITKKKNVIQDRNNLMKSLNYSSEDVEVMATQIRNKINKLQGSLLGDKQELLSVDKRELLAVDTNIDLHSLQAKGDTDQIFQNLQIKFPAVPPVILLTKALDISFSKSFDWNCIKQELEEANEKHQPKFKSYKFFPSRTHEFNKEKVIHSYIAGYQFHKMITRSSNVPVPLRTILNISEAIESITYIENNESTTTYKKQKDAFKQQGKFDKNAKVEELLLFHGTAVSSLDSILTTNFIVDALPQQQNTHNEQRKKAMMFGRGVYFSELPAISLMYGNGLLLCKVMPGKSEIFQPQGVPPPDISEEYDSREVQANDSQGVIHVVKSPTQILPYCVIQLKKQSLTSQCIKPTQCAQPFKPTHCVNPNPTAQCVKSVKCVSTIPSIQQEDWSVVQATEQKCNDKRATIEKTMHTYTTRTTISDDDPTCTICHDPLSSAGAVSLSSCGHKFHSSCIHAVISHQTGQQHIQCPNCQAIHGIKTGNQPAEGKMYFRKHTGQVPGYPECGMIVIKYTMVDGVQADSHPNPGKPFHARGFPRTAFLPDNQKGNHVLELLVKAFRRRLVFTVGSSLSRGEDDCVTWNGIHHKTQIQDNGNGHGYPDVGYLDRVQGELKQKGVE